MALQDLIKNNFQRSKSTTAYVIDIPVKFKLVVDDSSYFHIQVIDLKIKIQGFLESS